MLYSYPSNPNQLYFMSKPQLLQHYPIQSSQSIVKPSELRKFTSKKIDTLYEECLHKSNRILQENEIKLQGYLSTKSRNNHNDDKENQPKDHRLADAETQRNEPLSLSSRENYRNNAKNYETPDNNMKLQSVFDVKAKDLMEDNSKVLENTLKTQESEDKEVRFNGLREARTIEIEETLKKDDPKTIKNIELRLQLDELFEKCTKKTRECLENNHLKTELLTNIPLIQTKFLEDGSFYRGMLLKNGVRTGQGILYNALGKEIYNGDWENDEFNGQGILYVSNAGLQYEQFDFLSYEGNFKNGKFDGLAKITNKNGESVMKNFKNNEILEENEVKKDRLNTSLNKINEEEEKNSDNYEESLEQYFKEEFEMLENESRDHILEKNNDKMMRLSNDSHENHLKDLADNLCKPQEEEPIGFEDDLELDFIE